VYRVFVLNGSVSGAPVQALFLPPGYLPCNWGDYDPALHKLTAPPVVYADRVEYIFADLTEAEKLSNARAAKGGEIYSRQNYLLGSVVKPDDSISAVIMAIYSKDCDAAMKYNSGLGAEILYTDLDTNQPVSHSSYLSAKAAALGISVAAYVSTILAEHNRIMTATTSVRNTYLQKLAKLQAAQTIAAVEAITW
jgi:hypothetical protein